MVCAAGIRLPFTALAASLAQGRRWRSLRLHEGETVGVVGARLWQEAPSAGPWPGPGSVRGAGCVRLHGKGTARPCVAGSSGRPPAPGFRLCFQTHSPASTPPWRGGKRWLSVVIHGLAGRSEAAPWARPGGLEAVGLSPAAILSRTGCPQLLPAGRSSGGDRPAALVLKRRCCSVTESVSNAGCRSAGPSAGCCATCRSAGAGDDSFISPTTLGAQRFCSGFLVARKRPDREEGSAKRLLEHPQGGRIKQAVVRPLPRLPQLA